MDIHVDEQAVQAARAKALAAMSDVSETLSGDLMGLLSELCTTPEGELDREDFEARLNAAIKKIEDQQEAGDLAFKMVELLEGIADPDQNPSADEE